MSDHFSLSIALVSCAILLVLADPGLSQGDPVTDFSIELLEGIPFRTPPGSKGTFKFAVTNHSTDAGAPSILFSAIASPVPFVSGQGDALGFFRSDVPGNDCYIEWGIPTPAPGAPLVILYSTSLDALAPGETFVCEVEYWVNANFDFAADERIVDGQLPIEWHVATFNSDDPNPTNDTISLTFTFLAPNIPTLSPVGMVLLVVTLCISVVVLRGRRRRAEWGAASDTRSDVARPYKYRGFRIVRTDGRRRTQAHVHPGLQAPGYEDEDP